MAGLDGTAQVAIVAGSGLKLDGLFDRIGAVQPFAKVPGLAAVTIGGHEGVFRQGQCEGRSIVLQSGRFHLYEGCRYDDAVKTVDYLQQCGLRTILFTNAAGGLRETMRPGDLMAISEIRLWPYHGWEGHPESVCPDIKIQPVEAHGVYTWVHGPCYETRAEIHALRVTGADAVGMSTAPEIHRCRTLGIRTGALSCITNNCCQPHVLSHDEVVATAASASARMCEVIREAVRTGIFD